MENIISNLDYFEIISKYLFTDDIINVNKIFPSLNYYPPDGEEIYDFYASQENINKLKGKRIKSLEIVKADESINWDGVYTEILYVSVDLDSIPYVKNIYCENSYIIYVNCDKFVKNIYGNYVTVNFGKNKKGINCFDGNVIIENNIFVTDLSYDRLDDFKEFIKHNKVRNLICDFYDQCFESLNLDLFYTSAKYIYTVPKAKEIIFNNNCICEIIPDGVKVLKCPIGFKTVIKEIIDPKKIISSFGNINYDITKFENIVDIYYTVYENGIFYDFTKFTKLETLFLDIYPEVIEFEIKINFDISVLIMSNNIFKKSNIKNGYVKITMK